MKLSIFNALILALVPAVLAAPADDQSPNLVSRENPQWVWACDGENFSGKCDAVQIVAYGCYNWGTLFSGIGNGSFKTNANVVFFDGEYCGGNASNQFCGIQDSRNNYWYDHTVSVAITSTNPACNA